MFAHLFLFKTLRLLQLQAAGFSEDSHDHSHKRNDCGVFVGESMLCHFNQHNLLAATNSIKMWQKSTVVAKDRCF